VSKKKRDGKKKKERKKEKDSRFFFCLLLYSNKLHVNRWLTIFLLLSFSYEPTDNEALLLVSTVVDVRIDDKSTLE
jgi:hypothetical protein